MLITLNDMLKFTYANWLRSSNRKKNEFNFIVFLIFLLSFINIYYKISWTPEGFVAVVNLWNPCWLLFGPLLYFAYQVFSGAAIKIDFKSGLHFVPFVLFSIFFVRAYLGTDNSDPWQNPWFAYYQNTFLAIAISLLGYSIYIIRMVWRFEVQHKPSTESLILSVAAIYILISIITVTTYVVWGIVYFDMGIDYRLFAYALLFFTAIAIAWYWIFGSDELVLETTDFKQETLSEQGKSYAHSALTETLATTYKERITSCFNETTIYLDSNLSLELLSKDLEIPKHYLSQLFNVHFKKSFHHFVAEYRIRHVLALLNANNGRLKIESLAYSCGFNSKTSFNRYFKEKTGFTPSQYQVQLNRQLHKN